MRNFPPFPTRPAETTLTPMDIAIAAHLFLAAGVLVSAAWFPVMRRVAWLILWTHHLAGGPPPPSL